MYLLSKAAFVPGTVPVCAPSLTSVASSGMWKQGWESARELGGKGTFIPSSNRCAAWIHLNALNHAPNVDGSWVWTSVIQECYVALVGPVSSNIYRMEEKCTEIELSRITVKFLMCLELLTCIFLSSFVQVSLLFFGCTACWMNETCHETPFSSPHSPLWVIYSDELIKPLLSCHKGLLSERTYGTKASDAKRWNRGISLHLNWASLPRLFTLHQRCLPRLSLPVFLAFICDVSVVFS